MATVFRVLSPCPSKFYISWVWGIGITSNLYFPHEYAEYARMFLVPCVWTGVLMLGLSLSLEEPFPLLHHLPPPRRWAFPRRCVEWHETSNSWWVCSLLFPSATMLANCLLYKSWIFWRSFQRYFLYLWICSIFLKYVPEFTEFISWEPYLCINGKQLLQVLCPLRDHFLQLFV